MPAFSRLGPYPTVALDQLAYQRHELFEYAGHAACLLPTPLYPLFRWRMDAHAHGKYRLAQGDRTVRRRRARRGRGTRARSRRPSSPIAAAAASTRSGWSWNDGKRVMGGLLLAGQVAVAGRRGIEQLYDLTERVIPRDVLAAPVPDPDDAKRELIVLAARAMGVSTAKDLAAYFHIGGYLDRGADPKVTRVPALLADLVDDGRLVPVTVEGWRDQAYVVPGVRVPKVDRRAGARVTVRLADLGARSGAAGLRVRLPHRDLHPGAEAGARLLRAAVPARRHAGGAGRPQGRPQGRHAGGAERVLGAGRASPRTWPVRSRARSPRWPRGSGSSAPRCGTAATSRPRCARRVRAPAAEKGAGEGVQVELVFDRVSSLEVVHRGAAGPSRRLA